MKEDGNPRWEIELGSSHLVRLNRIKRTKREKIKGKDVEERFFGEKKKRERYTQERWIAVTHVVCMYTHSGNITSCLTRGEREEQDKF